MADDKTLDVGIPGGGTTDVVQGDNVVGDTGTEEGEEGMYGRCAVGKGLDEGVMFLISEQGVV